MLYQLLSHLFILLPLINCQILDHILVTSGDPNDESVKTEVIHLADDGNICTGLPDYPMPLDGASGGLIDDFGTKYPIVCGGYYYGDYYDDCIVIGNPEKSTKLVHARSYGAAVTPPGDFMWITGGKGGEFGEELSTSEIVEILDVPIVTEGMFV